MALPEFSMRQLLEAGVHYGHQTQRWNPTMGELIYGDRNGIHIIDLTQTVPMLDQALKVVRDTVAKGGRILFVGTKRQAQKPIAEAAPCALPSSRVTGAHFTGVAWAWRGEIPSGPPVAPQGVRRPRRGLNRKG